ncbi:MAG: Flp pilus assembly protein CpaB [Sandaracinaceae bacterium]|nr:Flp pilus assembly protein CpaB [Sandaracinaceae bacterium]
MNRTLLILSGALLAAGVAFFVVYADAYVEEETGGARVLVVAAALDIPFGRPMQREWLRTEELPQSYVEDRHIRASELRTLVGVPLAQSVRSGEAILRTDVSVLSDQQRTLSAEIPHGSRAMAIEAQQESSHAGLLRPGDRVDAILILGDRRVTDSGRAVVVAQNLLVLAVGQSLQSEFDDDRDRPGQYFTARVSLEVDLEEAQRLTIARQQGRLRLLLRNPNDATELAAPPEVLEPHLLDRARRQSWLRRFALVQPAPDEDTAAN